MYRKPDVVNPFQQHPKKQYHCPQPLLPSEIMTTSRQPTFEINSYQQPLQQEHVSHDPTSTASQDFYQPPPFNDPGYGTQQQGQPGNWPTFPQDASWHGFYSSAQATDMNSLPYIQSNFEHVHHSTPYATSRAWPLDTIPEQRSTYMGHDPLLPHGPDVGSALDFSYSEEQFGSYKADSLLESNFEYSVANWQGTSEDMSAGQSVPFQDNWIRSLQSADNQSYHHNHWGTDHSKTPQYSRNSWDSSFGQVPNLADSGLSNGNDVLPRYQQIYRDNPQDERSWEPVQPQTPYQSVSSSDTLASGARTSDPDLIDQLPASRKCKNDRRKLTIAHSQQGRGPIAIPRIAKKAQEERSKYFCARGCQQLLSRLSDLDRHERTQHQLKPGEGMFSCLLCSPDKTHKYPLKYNLLAHLTRMHSNIDLQTHPDGRIMLSWKDEFPQVPFYKTSLNGTIMIRAGSDVAKSLTGAKTPSAGRSENGPGIENSGDFNRAFQEKFEQWLLS